MTSYLSLFFAILTFCYLGEHFYVALQLHNLATSYNMIIFVLTTFTILVLSLFLLHEVLSSNN